MTVPQKNLTVPKRDLLIDLDQLNDLVHDLDLLRDLIHDQDQRSAVNQQTGSLNNRKLELQQLSFRRISTDQGHNNLDAIKTLKVCSGIQRSN